MPQSSLLQGNTSWVDLWCTPTPIRVEADRIYFYNYDIPFTGGQAYELLPEEKARLLLAQSVRVKSY